MLYAVKRGGIPYDMVVVAGLPGKCGVDFAYFKGTAALVPSDYTGDIIV
jgi:hypothetical protein